MGCVGDAPRTSPTLLGHHLGHCHDVELNKLFERNSMWWVPQRAPVTQRVRVSQRARVPHRARLPQRAPVPHIA